MVLVNLWGTTLAKYVMKGGDGIVVVVSLPDFLLGLAIGFMICPVYQKVKANVKQYGFIKAFKRLWGM